MFQSSPNYTMIYGLDVTGVYGYFNGSRFGLREYFHNQTLPKIFEQDMILKSMIDNLTNKINSASNLS